MLNSIRFFPLISLSLSLSLSPFLDSEWASKRLVVQNDSEVFRSDFNQKSLLKFDYFRSKIGVKILSNQVRIEKDSSTCDLEKV